MKLKVKHIPLLIRIIIAILLGIAFGFIMSPTLIRCFNTFNGVFDQLLKFLIPLIILGLVTSAIADVGRTAGKMLAITVAISYGATVLAGLFSFEFSTLIFPHVITETTAIQSKEAVPFPAFFSIEIPPIMGVMTALVTSFLMGLGIAAFGASTLKNCFNEFKNIVTLAISKLIIPLLPLYIFGLFLNMTASGQVIPVLVSFIQVIAIIFAMTGVLLILQYIIAGAIARKSPFRMLLNMMPAYFTALGTSSSAATIPVTLEQAKKNGVSEQIAGFVIPLCATIHISGSTLKIVACCIAIMMMNGMSFNFPLMLGFIFMLGITMVAAPGVPGGAIMASLGLLDSILGFSPEQQAMMITLYITMDSFGTACNVTGDGAIALIIDTIHKK